MTKDNRTIESTPIQGDRKAGSAKPEGPLSMGLMRSMLQRSSRRLANLVASVLLVTMLVVGATDAGASSLPIANTDLQAPIRAAFYYPWFPEGWNQQGVSPYTNYHPSSGLYDSSDQATLKQHIAAMQYGGIQAGIASWWGQGSKTDSRIPALLQAAAGTSFQWSIYYEPEGQGNPSAAQITNDLTYIHDHYAGDPGFLTIGGRFVVFVYADSADGCGMADRWKQANTVNAYIVLKVFSGYKNCSNQPDGWHQYAPSSATDSQGSYSYSISPGFWKVGESARLDRDLTRWSTNVRVMVASGATFQLITTFNEWGEGTAVESASEWSSTSGYGAFLDALHNNGQAQVSPSAIPGTSPTSVPIATTFSTTSSTSKFSPAADAYVNAGAPNTNYGASKQLRTDSSPVVRSYLRFNIQGLTGAVTKATLRVFSKSSSSAGYKVYTVSDTTWGEGAITYKNAPPLGSLAGSKGSFASGVWTTVDITPFVTGNGVLSLALIARNSSAVNYVSREGGADGPQLEITVNGTSPTTSPSDTPTQGSVATDTPTQATASTDTPTAAISPSDTPTQGSAATDTPTQATASTDTPTAAISPSDTPTQGSVATDTPTQGTVPTDTATQPIATTFTATQPISPTDTATPASSLTTLAFPAEADARVYQGAPTTNYGSSTYLQSDGSVGIELQSYFRFTVSGVSGPIQSAKLRVFCTTNGTVNGPAVYLSGNNWVEKGSGGITWNAQPGASGSASDNKGAIATNTWVEYNVVPLVAGNGTYSFVLMADSNDGVTLSSREGSQPPQLVISFGAGASPTAGPSATSTATQLVGPSNTPTQVIAPTNTPTQAAGPSNTPTQVFVPSNTPTQASTAAPTATKTSTPSPSNTPGASAIQHVFVVVMENHSYSEVWNTSASPYITSLGNSFARATNYHAVLHPSLPNYLSLYGGSNYGITTDCNPSSSCHVNATNLADNLEAKGLTWKGYMESMPSPCFITTSGNYAPKHDPFVYFDDIRNNATRCNSHVVPYTALATDLTSAATTPNFAFITPNLCNDMHDCSIATGDTWLKNNLPAILNSPACTVEKCLLILTWDEDDNGPTNQVLTIFAGSAAKTGGVASAVAYTHFSALRTVENIFGLPTQTSNDAAASPMTDLLK